MNLNAQEQPKASQSNPQAEVMALMNQAMVMGRNDYEPQEFQKIMIALNSGAMTPDEALNKVHGIMDSKQDYN